MTLKPQKMIKLPAASTEDDYKLQADLRTFIAYKKLCKDPERLKQIKALAIKAKIENGEVVAAIDEELSENDSTESGEE